MCFLNAGIDPLFQTRCEWFHLSLSSSVSATKHISIISATCILCYIKCFHHGYHLVLSSSPWYIFIFRFFLWNLLLCSPFHPHLTHHLLHCLSLLSFLSDCCIMLQYNIVTWVTNRCADLCHVDMIVTHLAGIVERLGDISVKWHWC